MIETVSYGGWNNCLRLSNDKVELIITTDVGPRVIRFGFIGGQNLLKEFDEQLGVTEGDEWLSFGGHRLWHAPEVSPRTYAPDFDPVACVIDADTVTLTQVVEPSTGIEKVIEISLDQNNARVSLTHKLINRNLWAIEVSPWCLTVMAAGGRAIIPQENFIPHGDGPGETFLPARPIVIWPFTAMGDPRFTWGTKYIQMRQDESLQSKQKFGTANTLKWAAYALNNELFIKSFPYDPAAIYPDQGCNCEFFTMPGFLELETLGALARIEPNDCATHKETWALHHQSVGLTDDEIDAALLQHVSSLLNS